MKRNFVIVILLSLVVIFTSCSSNYSKNSIDEKIEKLINLNLIKDEDIKRLKDFDDEIIYEGKNYHYSFYDDTKEVKTIYVKNLDSLKPDVEKSTEQLFDLSDKYLAKINDEFPKEQSQKKAVKSDYTIRIEYQERLNDILQPSYVVIELDKYGNLISYQRNRNNYVKSSSDYLVSKDQALEFAKKDFFSKYNMDQTFFEQHSGEISIEKFNYEGRNTWKIDLEFEDDYIKGGSYFVDSEDLIILKFEEFK